MLHTPLLPTRGQDFPSAVSERWSKGNQLNHLLFTVNVSCSSHTLTAQNDGKSTDSLMNSDTSTYFLDHRVTHSEHLKMLFLHSNTVKCRSVLHVSLYLHPWCSPVCVCLGKSRQLPTCLHPHHLQRTPTDALQVRESGVSYVSVSTEQLHSHIFQDYPLVNEGSFFEEF